MYIDDSIPKYIKKKKSKSRKKADHKHIYNEEVLLRKNNKRYCYANRCSICKKIGEVKNCETRFVEGYKYMVMLTQEEILKKYKGLPIIDME